MVSRNVDLLEDSVSQAEKDLEPSKIRKVFSSFPGLGVRECCVQWLIQCIIIDINLCCLVSIISESIIAMLNWLKTMFLDPCLFVIFF